MTCRRAPGWNCLVGSTAEALATGGRRCGTAGGGEDPAATITLTAWPDVDGLWKPAHDSTDTLWHPAEDPSDAIYAAKMMIPLARAGTGLGAEMLDWAGGRAYDAGLTWLRLDAWTTNVELHHYYFARGFQHVRTVTSRVSGACFQRAAQPYTRGQLKTEE